jgi:hypothetical protein
MYNKYSRLMEIHRQHKAQHKEKEIAKHDWNDNRIKRRKAGERDVSSNEDMSSLPAWSGHEPSAAVDWSDMSGSSTPFPPRAVEVNYRGGRSRPRARRVRAQACGRKPTLSERIRG